MKFVHAADIHLDSPLRGLKSRRADLAGEIATAGRRAFAGLIELTLESRAAFLVVAGDVFDGEWRDYHTGLVFAEGMARLARHGVPAVLLKGNHDAESRISRSLRLGDGVHVFRPRRPHTIRLEAPRVALHGQSYDKPAQDDNIVRDYPPAERGWFNVGVLHTALAGAPGHAPYAPCTVEDLLNKGYQYWALGHVHGHRVVHADPPVIYPGNVQGRHANEAGGKGCVVVEVEDLRVAGFDFVALDHVRWSRLDIDASGCRDFDEVLERVRAAVAEAAAGAGPRLLALRLTISGASAAHFRLHADRAATDAEMQAAATRGHADALVERVVLATRPPAAAMSAAAADALGEIARTLSLLRGDQGERAALRDQLAEILNRLPDSAKLPFEWRDLDDSVLDAVLDEAQPLLIERLRGEPG